MAWYIYSVYTHGKSTCALYVTVHLHFLDSKANDRVLLFIVDKGFQHIKGLGNRALEQLKEDGNMCDYQPLAYMQYVHNHALPALSFSFSSPKPEP